MTTYYPYTQLDETTLYCHFYPTTHLESKATIIYFHGGGLIFGDKDDLPKPYVELLRTRGYNLITIDYPLAPESNIKDIFFSIGEFFTWFEANYEKTLQINNNRKILFGRSAGAYLALQWALKVPVSGVISFYGYHTLCHNDFLLPSPTFQKYPLISTADISALLSSEIICSSTVESRYPIYLSLRQSGNWISSILGDKALVDDYSLKLVDLKKLPPLFITASQADEDVPVFLSKMLAKQAPETTFIQHKGLVHDFDRDVSLQESQDTYRELIKWLDEL